MSNNSLSSDIAGSTHFSEIGTNNEQQQFPHPKGISVFCLRDTLLHEVKETGLDEDSTIYQLVNLRESKLGVIRRKGAAIKCPRDGTMGAAYIDCLEGEDNVGPANRMLSYAWGYTIGDIIDSLEEYCTVNSIDPKRTYIWICCLCNNQHRVGENVAFDVFQTIFRDIVVGVGHVLALMAPWEKPLYLTRVWCVFEVYTANTTDACEVEIIMPPRETKVMLEDVRHCNNLARVLGAADIGTAEATMEADKKRIMELIKGDTGVATLNNHVNIILRKCIQRMILTAVGKMIKDEGDLEGALDILQKALATKEKAFGKDYTNTANAYLNWWNSSIEKTGDLNGALENLQVCVSMKRNSAWKENCLTLGIKNVIRELENKIVELELI